MYGQSDYGKTDATRPAVNTGGQCTSGAGKISNKVIIRAMVRQRYWSAKFDPGQRLSIVRNAGSWLRTACTSVQTRKEISEGPENRHVDNGTEGNCLGRDR